MITCCWTEDHPRGSATGRRRPDAKAENKSRWPYDNPDSRRVAMIIMLRDRTTPVAFSSPTSINFLVTKSFHLKCLSTCRHAQAVFSSFCETLTTSRKHLAPQQEVRGDAFHGDFSLVKLKMQIRFNINQLDGEAKDFRGCPKRRSSRARTKSRTRIDPKIRIHLHVEIM